jgi:hypothetical protein
MGDHRHERNTTQTGDSRYDAHITTSDRMTALEEKKKIWKS